MPWWMYIYIICFAIIVLANVIYWLMVKQKFLLTAYELLAGTYLIFVIVAYWAPFLKNNLSLLNILAVLAVAALNFYFSVLKKRNVDIKELFPDMDEERVRIARDFEVVEIAKAVPVLLASPAYIVGALLSFDVLKKYLG
ncbi:MAG: hypothetical protein A2017_13285 [Lentisphaerae bacterium GWF2_44_16]|nr:MAG: hypothetical protein A2017_13285 [Lentisphaerae bacterium GWF2_44_16]